MTLDEEDVNAIIKFTEKAYAYQLNDFIGAATEFRNAVINGTNRPPKREPYERQFPTPSPQLTSIRVDERDNLRALHKALRELVFDGDRAPIDRQRLWVRLQPHFMRLENK